ncbi:hypothetical protein GCM10010472_00280 [Pseudonocardia halophobica]|uniref:CopG family transcriptional regulator n=1 Tax=Pseudonocardia halophobica TaxID=29401 RepID=A0A9W6L8V7_9PSEU|nr:hypothetical protein [Pseudonocardia halophobica]GLL14895.1 hypothetical protein GCM10017577_60440 [Pseudonocardia halophobica]
MAGFRERRPSRHGAPARRAAGPELEQHDPELDSYLAALAPDAEPGATETTGRFGTAQVFQLRLPALRIEQLRRVADERGTSPGALATEWVLERLEQEDAPTGPMPVTAAEAGRRAQLRLRRRR